MERLNRKKIIKQLEITRQWISSVQLLSARYADPILEISARAQHFQLNKMITELGGESVEARDYSSYIAANNEQIEIDAIAFFEKSYFSSKEGTIKNIIDWLNHQFSKINVEYKNNNFYISGEDKQQQLKCYEMLKDLINFSGK